MNIDASQTGGAAAFPQDDEVFERLCDSKPFAEFESAMDAALEVLVARWIRWAAPNAGQRRLRAAAPVHRSKKGAK
jgi:hypothetical protein